MAQIKKGDPHGLAYVQIALVGTDGRTYGTAGPSLAVDGTSNAYLIREPLSAEIPVPDRTTIDFTGGDRWLGAYQYGITSLGSFNMSIASVDATLIALVTGASVDQVTNSSWTVYSENVLKDRLPQVCVMITFRLQGRETGFDGGDFFITYIIPRAWVAPKGVSGAPNFQSKGTYSFQVTPTAGDKFPHGIPFGANQGWQDNKAPVFAVISNNPLGLTTYIANGVATTYTLGYKPVSSGVTAAASPNQHALNGVAASLTSLSTTTALATLTAAGSSADYHGTLYETLFVAP